MVNVSMSKPDKERRRYVVGERGEEEDEDEDNG